jgi:hypothetical protein
MNEEDEKVLDNPKDLEVEYLGKKTTIGELTDEEKTDFIARLWLRQNNSEEKEQIYRSLIQRQWEIVGAKEDILAELSKEMEKDFD